MSPALSTLAQTGPFNAKEDIGEFSQEVGLMAEHDENPPTYKELVEALTDKLARQTSAKPHPIVLGLLCANIVPVITLVFFFGVQSQKIANLEATVHSQATQETVSAQMLDLKESQSRMGLELQGLRDRFDRFMDRREGVVR